MKKGVLLFCFDTPEVKYHKVLERCVSLVNKNLGLDTTVITNIETFKQIQPLGMINYKLIEPNRTNKLLGRPWYQVERHMAYDLSPYDKTLLMDIDYFCYTNNLLEFLDSEEDFLIHDKAYDVVTGNRGYEFTRHSIIPIVWATVIMFKKTQYAKSIFDTVGYVKQHWPYFCDLYRLRSRNYRNDYAFSIALNQVNGNLMPKLLPTRIPHLSRDAKVVEFTENGLIYRYKDTVGKLENQDIHVLNKEIVDA